ncbi:MAG: hydroxymethylbilane synthase [Actinomycetota bacterium]
MPRSVLRIGTRTSPLALAQAELVRQQVSQVITHRSFELVPMSTAGDRGDDPAANKEAWVAELQEALTSNKVDLVVHSVKDLPVDSPRGIVLGGVPKREDPRDCILTRTGKGLGGLATGSTVGTSSLRRSAQLRALPKGLRPVPIRGNVDTRIKKMTDAEVDAVVLAVAGLKRLRRSMASAEILPITTMLPAPGQGALAVECRATDRNMRAALGKIEDEASRRAVDAERSLVAALGGDCHLPIAALAEIRDDTVRLRGLVASEDGTTVLTDQVEHTDAEKAGIELAERLRARGADALLRS